MLPELKKAIQLLPPIEERSYCLVYDMGDRRLEISEFGETISLAISNQKKHRMDWHQSYKNLPEWKEAIVTKAQEILNDFYTTQKIYVDTHDTVFNEYIKQLMPSVSILNLKDDILTMKNPYAIIGSFSLATVAELTCPYYELEFDQFPLDYVELDQYGPHLVRYEVHRV